jgi:type III pantothenate kinase
VHCGVQDNADTARLRQEWSMLPPPARIIVANVAGSAREQQLRDLCAAWEAVPEFIAARSAQCGVTNRYERAERLGSDRWAALIGAWKHQQRACLVVNCGTATTVDALSDQGEFLGGTILPGLRLMRQSLAHNTAQLPDAAGMLQDFPRDTADAIYSGAIRATQGAIRYQYGLLQNAAAVCLLSGGAADQIQMQLGIPVERVDNLVLQGLQMIGETSA